MLQCFYLDKENVNQSFYSKFKIYYDDFFSKKHQFSLVSKNKSFACKTCLTNADDYKQKLEMYYGMHPSFKNKFLKSDDKFITYFKKTESFSTSSDMSMSFDGFYLYEINFLSKNSDKDENLLLLNLWVLFFEFKLFQKVLKPT